MFNLRDYQDWKLVAVRLKRRWFEGKAADRRIIQVDLTLERYSTFSSVSSSSQSTTLFMILGVAYELLRYACQKHHIVLLHICN